MQLHRHPVFQIAAAVLFLAACNQPSTVSRPVEPGNLQEDVVAKTLSQIDASLQSSAQAASSALVFVDSYAGSNYVTPALSALGYGITVASSQGDFDTQLAVGSFDLAVNMIQSNYYSGDIIVLHEYIAQGGRVVAADWTQNASLATALDASFTKNVNQTVADFAAPLDRGITDPLTLGNPGWGTFSTGLSPDAGGVSYCEFGNADSCLVLGNSGRTALLGFLSDAPPASEGQQLFENIFSLVGAPVSSTYLMDFESVSTGSYVRRLQVGNGIVHQKGGQPTSRLVPVVGQHRQQGRILSARVAKVLEIDGSKRLAVVRPGTNNPAPQGGRIKLNFAPLGRKGVTLTSLTLGDLGPKGAVLRFQRFDGTSSRKRVRAAAGGGARVVPLDVSGLRAVDIFSPSAFTVDDVTFSSVPVRR